jgi:hypothetical protein
MNLRLACVALIGLSMSVAAGAQGRSHVHGAASLGIVIEPGSVTVQLETPLDGLLGFERAPRTDAEKRRATAAVATLRGADALFRFTPAAGCTSASVELGSAALGLGQADANEAHASHAELDGAYVFRCADTARLTEVDIGLFSAFPGMQRLQVEVAAARGQFKRDLKRPAQRVSLVR